MIESNRIYIFFRFDCSSIDRINRIQSFDWIRLIRSIELFDWYPLVLSFPKFEKKTEDWSEIRTHEFCVDSALLYRLTIQSWLGAHSEFLSFFFTSIQHFSMNSFALSYLKICTSYSSCVTKNFLLWCSFINDNNDNIWFWEMIVLCQHFCL